MISGFVGGVIGALVVHFVLNSAKVKAWWEAHKDDLS